MQFQTFATNIRQARKAFNRMNPDGTQKVRDRDYHLDGGVRRYGRKYQRVQKPEDVYRDLINEGIVRVVRQHHRDPVVHVQWDGKWVDLQTFQMSEQQQEELEVALSTPTDESR
jgi:hypothetical protein